MKKLFLCGIAVLVFSLTPAVEADNVRFNDDITSPPYSVGDINGEQGWTTTVGVMNFISDDGGILQSASAADAIATNTFTTLPAAGDTILNALFFGRFARNTGFETTLSLRSGATDVLTFGTNGTGDVLSGTGLTYNELANPFSTAHTYQQLRLTYDEAGGGVGTLFATPTDNLGVASGSEVTAASFTGSIDVSSLTSLSVTSSAGADRIGSINVQTVPEPGSLALGLMCLAGLATRRRRS